MLQNLDFIVAYGLCNGENPVFQDLKRRTAYYGRSLKPQKTWFCGYETVTAEKVEIVRRLPNPGDPPVKNLGPHGPSSNLGPTRSERSAK